MPANDSSQPDRFREQLLATARSTAQQDRGYSSAATRTLMSEEFTKLKGDGSTPYNWQLDVSEALLLGLDCIVLAGTGAGKTYPFVLPLLADVTKKKKVVIISPLNALQDDQATRFQAMGLSATPVNSDVWSSKLKEDIVNDRYQVLLTSPEMILEHHEFGLLMRTPEFTNDIIFLVVDEAHCICQWGHDFRKKYGELEKLRSFVPMTIPILATSATMTPAMVTEVQVSLKFSAERLFFLNLGNDRPNITPIVCRMRGAAKDLDALNFLLDEAETGEDLVTTIVYVNTRKLALKSYLHLKNKLPSHLHDQIDFIHGCRSKEAKAEVMKRFMEGKIKILCATEVAGMGLDARHIVRIVELMVPQSLGEWVQHHGRAGRGGQPSYAILLVEPSVFKITKRKYKRPKTSARKNTASRASLKRKRDNEEHAQDEDGDDNEDGEYEDVEVDVDGNGGEDVDVDARDDNEDEDGSGGEELPAVVSADHDSDQEHDADDDGNEDDDREREEIDDEELILPEDAEDEPANDQHTETVPGVTYQKKVEPAMRKWLETNQCRRAIVDEHYQNPPRQQPPTGACCDNCVLNKAADPHAQLSEPELEAYGIIGRLGYRESDTDTAEPQRSRRRQPKGLGARQGERLEDCRTSLLCWRRRCWRQNYGDCAWGPDVLLPTKILKALATKAHLQTIDQIKEELPDWDFVDEHGEEVINRLKPIDDAWRKERKKAEDEKKAKKRKISENNKIVREEKRRQDKQAANQARRHQCTSRPVPSSSRLVQNTAVDPAAYSHPAAYTTTDPTHVAYPLIHAAYYPPPYAQDAAPLAYAEPHAMQSLPGAMPSAPELSRPATDMIPVPAQYPFQYPTTMPYWAPYYFQGAYPTQAPRDAPC